jgi:hypothetical protein
MFWESNGVFCNWAQSESRDLLASGKEHAPAFLTYHIG